LAIKFGEDEERQQVRIDRARALQQAQEDRARQAAVIAKERGLELPPVINTGVQQKNGDDVGKGLFDGW